MDDKNYRLGKIEVNDVLPRIISKHELTEITKKYGFKKAKQLNLLKSEFLGKKVKVYSARLNLFKEKGVKCVTCGIEGSYFALESKTNKQSYHLELYAIDKDGNEIMMTKDHIIPESKGGKTKLENLQPMCIKCNINKGASIPE